MTTPDPRDYLEPNRVNDWSQPSGHRSDGLLGNEPTHIAATLRDAAVDPHDDDFPGVPNAGTAGADGNPHGPNVVAIEVGSAAWEQAVQALP